LNHSDRHTETPFRTIDDFFRNQSNDRFLQNTLFSRPRA
jgi:hypothetical protein